MTATANTGDDQTKSIEDLQAELSDLKDKLSREQSQVTKLRADLTEAKANSGNQASLQSQIDKLITEKSKLMKEKDDLSVAFDAHKKNVQVAAAKQHLTTALEEAGARNAATAMKLIDMSAVAFDENGQVVLTSIAEVVNAVKTSDPVLFKDEGEAAPNVAATPKSAPTIVGQPPAVKHAADRLTKSGYEVELAAAEATGRQENIDAVFDKYHGQKA